ncbi:MAG: G5 domain-containing protein [Armatimonadota bacterium]|nr:G5 domain-containing protein [bacterium]
MDNEQIIRNLRLQLLIERIFIAVIAIILITAWGIGRIRGDKSMIVVDGRPVVCVPSEQEAKGVLQEVKRSTGCDPAEIEFKQEVRVASAPRDAHPVSRHKAVRVVRHAVSPVVPRWSVIVDGRPIVAVPDRKTAGDVLELAKMKFGQMAKNLAEEPQFKESVKVDVAAIDPALYCKTAEQAVKLIFHSPVPVRRDAIYVVENGDVASSIASRHGLSLAELESLNPGITLDRLQIGDKIRIKQTQAGKAKLTVVVRDQSERIESTRAPIQRVSSASLYTGKTVELSPGTSGKRQIKVATIYENGRKVGSEILEETVLRDPAPRRIAIGIKPRR